MKIVIINGPNLNLLGKREPTVYGVTSFEDYLATLSEKFDDIKYFQSNVEGELINKLHEVGFDDVGIVMNAGGYTHTSVAIADAIASIEAPVVEVHISNIHAREEFRHQSLTAGNCIAAIAGLGLYGYDAAIEFLRKREKGS